MTDLMTRLAAARHSDADLDAQWPPADREARLRTVLAAERRRRRVRRTVLPAAAAAVAAVVLVPPVLDSGDAAAADLHALARSAVRYDGPVPSEGTWLHERETSRQHDEARDGHPAATYRHERETWSSWDGSLLLIDRTLPSGTPEYDVLHARTPVSYQNPNPAFASMLPTDADGLLGYLGPRVFGSSSHAEAMYEALVTLAGSHTLPPATLAATFDALAEIEHVATERVDVDGRPAVEVSYDESLTHSTESYVFDLATGQELSSHDHSGQGDFVSTTTLSEVVDAVPADVLAQFRADGDVDLPSAVGAPQPR